MRQLVLLDSHRCFNYACAFEEVELLRESRCRGDRFAMSVPVE
jgi:hypothetical protein